ncbi:MAG TPA: hypothetical protein VFV38_33195 [Ktedonobacteraceae bacterium]|nr:hypothetical protein [Ktedonobacteraceae bacterium]
MDVEHSLSSLLPGAILPSRLAWLCQPEQIEYTLALLFSLNRWKNASHLLLYADRQGLQDIQTVLLAQAIRQGSVQAVAYVDGSGQFPDGLLLDSVAESAARSILIHLKSLCDPDICPPLWSDGDCLY